MRNVTVTLDDETAQWARMWAARHNTSVFKLLGEVLAEHMHRETGYEAAKNRFLGKPFRRLKDDGTDYPDRQSLHDRDSLR